MTEPGATGTGRWPTVGVVTVLGSRVTLLGVPVETGARRRRDGRLVAVEEVLHRRDERLHLLEDVDQLHQRLVGLHHGLEGLEDGLHDAGPADAGDAHRRQRGGDGLHRRLHALHHREGGLPGVAADLHDGLAHLDELAGLGVERADPRADLLDGRVGRAALPRLRDRPARRSARLAATPRIDWPSAPKDEPWRDAPTTSPPIFSASSARMSKPVSIRTRSHTVS